MIALFARPALRKNPHSWLVVFTGATVIGLPHRRSAARIVITVRYRAAVIGIVPEWMR